MEHFGEEPVESVPPGNPNRLEMRVTVSNLSRWKRVITLPKLSKVLVLMERIYGAGGGPSADLQVLLYDGNCLDKAANQRLADCGVRDGSHLFFGWKF
jgi:hypothetical protein